MLKTVEREKIRIVTLPVSAWHKYKELRLRALQREPLAFCSTYARETAWPDEKWQQRLRDAHDNESWIIFAKLDEKLVGMIGGNRNDEDKQNHRCHIWGMYVDEKARKKGIAKALITKLLDSLRENEDVNVVRIEVNVNQKPAKQLYQILGFRKIGTEKVAFGDGSEHKVLVMEKLLRTPSNKT